MDALLGLWTFAAVERPDGNLYGLSDDDLASVSGWPRTRTGGELCLALIASGWLEGGPGERRLHDWEEHQGWASHAEARRQKARHAANILWDGKRKRDAQAYAVADAQALLGHDAPSPSPSPSPLPSPTSTQQPAASRRQAPAAPSPARSARQVAGPEGTALRAFDTEHRKVISSPYMAAFARDRKILRDVLKVYGLPRTVEMIAAFFDEIRRAGNGDEKAWTGKARPDVPGFAHQIPNLLRDWQFDTPIEPSQEATS